MGPGIDNALQGTNLSGLMARPLVVQALHRTWLTQMKSHEGEKSGCLWREGDPMPLPVPSNFPEVNNHLFLIGILLAFLSPR